MNATTVIAAISALVAAVSAAVALRVYRMNALTKRAEFLSQLHQAFFVDQTYKRVRNILDQDPGISQKKIADFVNDAPASFTDFLNFFELAAYFGHCKTLSESDIEALLGYYLDLLDRNEGLRAYIANVSGNGFEHLNSLLNKRKSKRK